MESLNLIPQPQKLHSIYKLIFAMRRSANDIKYGFNQSHSYVLTTLPLSQQSLSFAKTTHMTAKVFDNFPSFMAHANLVAVTMVNSIAKIRQTHIRGEQ